MHGSLLITPSNASNSFIKKKINLQKVYYWIKIVLNYFFFYLDKAWFLFSKNFPPNLEVNTFP